MSCLIPPRLPFVSAVGYTHASSVIPVVSPNDAAFSTVTFAVVPLNTSALPYRPAAVHVAPLTAPVWLFPEASPTAVPAPSLNPHAATSPAIGAVVVGLATPEYPRGLPAASVGPAER